MNAKAKHIRDISERNSLPNIFNDDIVREKYKSKVYPISGFPNFHYGSMRSDQREEFVEKDRNYYYKSGSEVRVDTESGPTIGKILRTIFESEKVVVAIEGEESTHCISNITRIL